MKDNYNDVPIKDEYIPKHASNYMGKACKFVDDGDVNKDKIKVIYNKKKKRKIKKWVWSTLAFIFLVIIIVCIIILMLWNKDNSDTSKIIEEIDKNIIVIEKEDDDNTQMVGEEKEEKESDYWYYIKFPLISVDINKLKEVNADTVGWINVNNTNINYPYVQYSDNNYYLNHSFDKTYNEAGWVFIDYRNSSNLNNKNTIIYAHSRLDKTMFGSLSKVLKKDWYTNKENHIIRIVTENESTLWQIFSVYKIEEESYYITTDFDNNEEYVKFLNTIKSRSIYNFNTNLDADDRILTLSTCYSDTMRTVVHAKLIKKGENN